jgi:uncharacterized protein
MIPERLRSDWPVWHGLALVTFMVVGASIPALRVWPLLWLAPVLAYGALVAIVPPFRNTAGPWRFGAVSKITTLAAVIFAIGACGVLLVFDVLAKPDVRHFGHFIPVTQLGGVVIAGVIFSVLNALLEEIIFRGVLFDAVESQCGVWGAVVGTAAMFGYGHMQGYPPGALGAVLAGVFGLCLGWLRVVAGGLGLPVLVHIVADATIFTLVARAGAFRI